MNSRIVEEVVKIGLVVKLLVLGVIVETVEVVAVVVTVLLLVVVVLVVEISRASRSRIRLGRHGHCIRKM